MAEPRGIFDPRAAATSVCSSAAGAYDDDGASGVSSDHDFAFAFNNNKFSDRILRIEIYGGLAGGNADWGRNRKRRREDAAKNDAAADISAGGDHAYIDDAAAAATEDEDGKMVAMVDASVSGDEAAFGSDSSGNMVCSSAVRVKSIHISSPILAAKSPFFYQLFSDLEKRHVTLQINDSEEAAFMELLNFMYCETLATTSVPAILDVLMAADKFEVASCMRHCSRLLKNLTMTPESALLYLDLASSVHMVESVLPLIDAAKQYLVSHYKDFIRFQKEVLCLPLAGIEAILSSDDVQVTNEDAVYEFVLKWARAQYPNPEERREILTTHLGRLIRFSFMSCRKLKKLLSCSDLDNKFAAKVVCEALFFKAEPLYRRRALAMDETSNRRFVERAYKYRPVKVVEFEAPFTQCIVYLDLKREECANLSPSGRIFSQAFHLAEQGFFLSAHCNTDQLSSSRCFGLFLGMQEKGADSFAVDYEFAARTRPLEEFVVKYKGNYRFAGGRAVGYRNLFQIPWELFIAEESLYFINDVLHLRAKLTIKPEEK